MTAPLSDRTDYGNLPGDGPLRPGGVTAPLPSGEDLPSKRSKASEAQQPALRTCRDVNEGNERIKAQGQIYLPAEPAEDGPNYRNRLARSVFTNFFRRAIDGLTGLVFAKDPQLGTDVPARIVVDAENIDLAGTHLDVFAREIFADAQVAGHAAILVDFPRTDGK